MIDETLLYPGRPASSWAAKARESTPRPGFFQGLRVRFKGRRRSGDLSCESLEPPQEGHRAGVSESEGPTLQPSSIVFGKDESRPERISRPLGEAARAGGSEHPAISGDGRSIAFASREATSAGAAGITDVMVWQSGTPGAVTASVSSAGVRGDSLSGGASLSADGRLVAFQSQADNLGPGADARSQGVFVRDLATGTTTCVSLAPTGAPGDGGATQPAISADGHFVAFTSSASNLVESDTNAEADVFLHDRASGATRRVSVATDGSEANGRSESPAVSADGRFVAFASSAGNLVPGDANGAPDVFVRDVPTGRTECVSLGLAGGTADRGATHPGISGDGRFVTFTSSSSDLVTADWTPLPTGLRPSHVYVHDRETHETRRIDVEVLDGRRMGDACQPSISADGRFVAYQAMAARMSHDDDPERWQIHVADLETGEVQRVTSGPSASALGNGHSMDPVLSADGSWIAFASSATNLVPEEGPRVTSIYRAPNPLPRAREQRASDALRREEPPAGESPRIENGDGFVIVDGVRIPVRSDPRPPSA